MNNLISLCASTTARLASIKDFKRKMKTAPLLDGSTENRVRRLLMISEFSEITRESRESTKIYIFERYGEVPTQ